jgi:protoporphyrinogen oxidase
MYGGTSKATSPMRIAIVGAGISGLVVAHLLHARHEIAVLEAADHAGGHTSTIRVDTRTRPITSTQGSSSSTTATRELLQTAGPAPSLGDWLEQQRYHVRSSSG